MKLLKPAIYVIVIFIILYLLTMKTAPSLTDPVATVEVPGTYTSLPFNEFRKLVPKRLEYIKDKSNFLYPYDKDKFAMIEDKVSKVNDEQMIAMLFNTPNIYLGYYRLEPIKTSPESVTSYQFEQGTIGWFWFYGTFIDKDGKTASYMFYVNRLDIFPPDLRKEMNLPMGSTTYYNISMGVGREGKWSSIPFKIARGEYSIKSDSVFSLNCIDLPEGWKFSFASNGKGKFKVDGAFKDDSLKQQAFSMDVVTERTPFLNGPKYDGCAPCQGGAGTLYLSYTQMKSNGTVTVNDSVTNVTDGTSWLDRQWANSQISKPYLSLLANSLGIFNDKTGGLGKYVWLNFHLGKDLQYMVFNFFPLSENVTAGTKFISQQIRYGAGHPEYGLTGDAEVLETSTVDGVTFPLKYKVATKDGVITIDGTKFDKSVCTDVSNNLHWDGSAILYDTTGKMVGTGFIEGNQFADPDIYVANELKSMGLEVTDKNKEYFKEEGKLPLSQGLPSLVILVLAVGSLITLLILLFKSFKGKSTTEA